MAVEDDMYFSIVSAKIAKCQTCLCNGQLININVLSLVTHKGLLEKVLPAYTDKDNSSIELILNIVMTHLSYNYINNVYLLFTTELHLQITIIRKLLYFLL